MTRKSLVPGDYDAAIVLVRHGESTWIAENRFQGHRDPPLSPRGEGQARLVAARLADATSPPALPIPAGPPLAIWHSPLQRAQATAVAIGIALGVGAAGPPLVPEPGLAEIGQGEWEGLPADDVGERYAAELARWRRAPVGNEAPGGERLTDADDRVRAALAAILPTLAGGSGSSAATGASAGSGAPTGHGASAVADLRRSPVPGYGPPPPPRPWGIAVAHEGIFRLALLALLELPLERFWTFPFILTGITVVELHDGRAVLRAHNLADHLAPPEAASPRA